MTLRSVEIPIPEKKASSNHMERSGPKPKGESENSPTNIILNYYQGDIEMAASKRNQCLKGEKEIVQPLKLKESLTVKCVCPKCGSDHRMKMIWTGRGKPKKFCPSCKIFVSSLEHVDFCPMPANVESRID